MIQVNGKCSLVQHFQILIVYDKTETPFWFSSQATNQLSATILAKIGDMTNCVISSVGTSDTYAIKGDNINNIEAAGRKLDVLHGIKVYYSFAIYHHSAHHSGDIEYCCL